MKTPKSSVRKGEGRALSERMLRKLCRVADIADLYMGPPCFNKYPVDSDKSVLFEEHGKDSVHITLGECRALRASLGLIAPK